jgi:hypothetical protein
MKDWIDQLKKIKNTLVANNAGTINSDTHVKESNKKQVSKEKPRSLNIHAVIPSSWRNTSNSTTNRANSQCANRTQSPATTIKGEALKKTSADPLPEFKPLFDDLSLDMPAWVNSGRSLQHPQYCGGNNPGTLSIRIGIDFGTAFTKVAIRAGLDLLCVKWSAVTSFDSEQRCYFLPGVVARTSGGEYTWKKRKDDKLLGNLKLPIIDTNTHSDCPVDTLAFLALVIRFSRAFLYQSEIAPKLIQRRAAWEVNIGCPTKPHENQETVNYFRQAVRVAWQLAAIDSLSEKNINDVWLSTIKEEPSTDNLSEKSRHTTEGSLAPTPSDIRVGLEAKPGVVPEFVAQIAGYLKSPHVGEGLHALVDIGAATLDVATFNVVKPPGEQSVVKIPIFYSSVSQQGTHYLNSNRHTQLHLDMSWDDASPVKCESEFAELFNCSIKDIEHHDSNFMEQVVQSLFTVINNTRTNIHGDQHSSAWTEGLRIFITGGGADYKLYDDAIKELEKKLSDRIANNRFVGKSFKLLRFSFNNLSTSQNIPIYRLSVATGLTEDAEHIAQIIPHRHIPPLVRNTVERRNHEDLYPGK